MFPIRDEALTRPDFLGFLLISARSQSDQELAASLQPEVAGECVSWFSLGGLA